MPTKMPSLVIIEDSEPDAQLVLRALRRSSWEGAAFIARSANEARALLGNWQGQPPRLILLDLHLPDAVEYELLDEIRASGSNVPVLIITSKANDDQVEEAYLRGANGFIDKPRGFDDMLLTIDRLAWYWLETNRVPALRPR